MSYDFGGGDSYRATTDFAALDITGSALTIAVWVRPDRVNSGDAILCKWNNDFTAQQQYRMRCGPSGNVQCLVRGSTTTYEVNSAAAATISVWNHFGLNLSGTGANQFSAWLNGTQTTGTASQAIQNTAELASIAIEGTGNQLDGSIAELGVWNVSLTNDEMVSLARGTPPPRIRRNSLAYYVPFNTSAAALDLSGSKNTMGTVGGTPVFLENNHPPVDRWMPMPS